MSSSNIQKYPDVTVEEYVKQHEGKRRLKKVLVSNNGIAAVKGIRSMREWAAKTFNDQHAVQFVAMATPEDMAGNAEYIRLADEMEEVPGGASANNYSNVELIIEIALRRKCDAVWPGWGHASENPDLPRSCKKAGLMFVGPEADAMYILGDKISSTIIAETADVPTMGWSGIGLRCKTEGPVDERIPEELYMKACVSSLEEALACAGKIGYPIMIKASEGGGGKGIRKVTNDDELRVGYRQVQDEVIGSPIFLMKLGFNCRHLEVQLIADEYNNAIALYSRDCSVQRRHQKIIEEGPVTICPNEQMLREMEQAAVRLSRSVNYRGAGTVEYLYTDEKFYFLELNPRLQVEHPVTEWITGINLPSVQLQIAMGLPLYAIPDIRKFYGKNPNEVAAFDLNTTAPVPPNGHTIACRVTAENPEEGFQPTSGKLEELHFKTTPNVWGYFSLRSNGEIHSYSDSQFGHIFAHGETREQARRQMLVALSELRIRGEIRTTTEYLISILQDPDFKNNNHTTSWLDKRLAEKVALEKPDTPLVVMCGALHTLHANKSSSINEWLANIEKGQSPEENLLNNTHEFQLIYSDLKYKILGTYSSENRFTIVLNGVVHDLFYSVISDGGLLLKLPNGESHVTYAQKEPTGLRVIVDGKVCLFEDEYDPSLLRAAATGKLVRYLVEDNAKVEANQPYVELEVMKMIMPLKCPLSGTIKLNCIEGSTIAVGDILANLDLEDKSQIKKTETFQGTFNVIQPVLRKTAHARIASAVEELFNVLNGYTFPEQQQENLLLDMQENLELLSNAQAILLGNTLDVLAAARAAVPDKLYAEIQDLLAKHNVNVKNIHVAEDSSINSELKELVNTFINNHNDKDDLLRKLPVFLGQLAIAAEGSVAHQIRTIAPLLQHYIDVEQHFDQGKRREAVLLGLRENHKDNLIETFNIAFSRARVAQKNRVVRIILQVIDRLNLVKQFKPQLDRIAEFRSRVYSEVVLIAKQMLIRNLLPSYQQIRTQMNTVFSESNCETPTTPLTDEQLTTMKPIIEKSDYNFDVLMSFFNDQRTSVHNCAVEVYVRRVYTTFDIKVNLHGSDAGFRFTTFTFSSNEATPMSLGSDVIVGAASTDSMSTINLGGYNSDSGLGFGAVLTFNDIQALESNFKKAVETIFTSDKATETAETLVLHVYIPQTEAEHSDKSNIQTLTNLFAKHDELLKDHDIRRVTAIIKLEDKFPYYYTFRQRHQYQEDPIYRHIEPTLAFQLQLRKLSNYSIKPYAVQTPSVHIYHATKKKKQTLGRAAASSKYDYLNTRFFVRQLVLRGDVFEHQDKNMHEAIYINEAHKYLNDALKNLELAMSDSKYADTYCNHIFVNVIPAVFISPDLVQELMTTFQDLYAKRLWALRISEVEIQVKVKTHDNDTPAPLHIFARNRTGYNLTIDIYSPKQVNGQLCYNYMNPMFNYQGDGILQDVPLNTPYEIMKPQHLKRRLAHNYNTSYVHDFPFLFERQLSKIWKSFSKTSGFSEDLIPSKIVHARELVLANDEDKLVELKDNLSYRVNGMIAWVMTLNTPAYPKGRDIVVIANDITYLSGSFGPEEDLVFNLASQYSREHGIPRIYITANSGARIGVATEVQNVFKVKWNDPENPQKGYDYLYLTKEDYEQIKTSVLVEETTLNGETIYKITDIIGAKDGLGVENLRGSGMIAGETSRAYQDVFTLNYVSSRTVGIGAYLVRLGQRVIQNSHTPILLTGAGALNKVLNRTVYSSNLQLGGIQIMHPNGVTHSVVKEDGSGVRMILQWLNYIPKTNTSPLPIIRSTDPIDRKIGFSWEKDVVYNPRHMLAGVQTSDDTFMSGFFDRDSFFETLDGWAQNIVVGRARLGGIPMGCISVDVQTIQQIIPADPADAASQERVVSKAGQVWFPDSAYKTAQAIRDFNCGEQLPLMIFANWRGFSGGQRDMYDEILKFGSFIVDALVDYKQPVFVYIPPHAELRGGAWVVVDPTINPDMMEMYAAEEAKGGVLEPNGTVEIKYRKPQVENTIRRLDPVYAQLAHDYADPSKTHEEQLSIEQAMKKRVKSLIPIYNHVAIKFCDLHDTPGRMKKKGVISEIIPWARARTFFYYRLRRRLAQLRFHKQVVEASVNQDLSYDEQASHFKHLIPENIWNDNKKVVNWIERNDNSIASYIANIRSESTKSVVSSLLAQSPDTVMSSLVEFLKENPSLANQVTSQLSN
mmetsp:Transcript_3124/g.4604  ORF Transcript_3124/g.4604 Transcript_3124/m.4604 type:complete len:2205 (-) Transcript_3124:97-6711(-)|eukprot:CAMPEP_0117418256 /NCGR_PEP_ID=MMETSP0758-20121206/78_1 /TAXON_ID=63605 /ORGANISM="Percolomonas cosmopolitus, Strain AE-1 (ATCC 50343)" /LENGTH=2204 /DNA_ID=CAMNT_0005198659 /DNA_START=43 /DNA_END=6657 /DNA_ORIENTATION=-